MPPVTNSAKPQVPEANDAPSTATPTVPLLAQSTASTNDVIICTTVIGHCTTISLLRQQVEFKTLTEFQSANKFQILPADDAEGQNLRRKMGIRGV